VEIILRNETVDYILTICVVWLIMIGFFLVLTREVLLLLGVVFPVLIIILIKNSKNRNSKVTGTDYP
jgi:ABC-type transport system involved in cytochrome bd biosynthesis fused ATPase/permease subunit